MALLPAYIARVKSDDSAASRDASPRKRPAISAPALSEAQLKFNIDNVHCNGGTPHPGDGRVGPSDDEESEEEEESEGEVFAAGLPSPGLSVCRFRGETRSFLPLCCCDPGLTPDDCLAPTVDDWIELNLLLASP